MQKRKAILHIGTAKTGSTTIQRLLSGNREALIADGFAYPRAPGRHNHMRLAICGADPRQAERMARVLGEKDDLAAILERLRRELDAEFAALPDSVHTVIFSNEHCYAKIDTPEAAERLKAFLSPWFDRMEVLVYLRRQDEFAVSRYTTRLRAGGFESSVLPAANAEFNAEDDEEDTAEDAEPGYAGLPASSVQPVSRMLDWAAMLDIWASAFGKAALKPRIFDRREFFGHDLVLDFLHCCGLPETYAGDARVHNVSMRPEAQEFLRRYNELRHAVALASGTPKVKVPSGIKKVLARDFSGTGRLPLRREVEAFLSSFEEANERLRIGYFPDRERVFSADLSRYPTSQDAFPDPAAVLEVAMQVIVDAKVGPIGPAEEAFRRGERFSAANRRFKAIQAYREALSLDGTLNKARRALRALERSSAREGRGAMDTDAAEPARDRVSSRDNRAAARPRKAARPRREAAATLEPSTETAPARPGQGSDELAARRAARAAKARANERGKPDRDSAPDKATAKAPKQGKPTEAERTAARELRQRNRQRAGAPKG